MDSFLPAWLEILFIFALLASEILSFVPQQYIQANGVLQTFINIVHAIVQVLGAALNVEIDNERRPIHQATCQIS